MVSNAYVISHEDRNGSEIQVPREPECSAECPRGCGPLDVYELSVEKCLVRMIPLKA